VSTFDVLRISGSGLYANRKWMDAVSDNLANANTATRTDQSAFQERMVVVEAADYGSGNGGVRVAGAQFGSAEGRLVYEPNNALADADGYVRYPDIDMADQMTQLIQAQRSYQANLSTIDRATEAYKAALQLGKG
jgi:flagellar basal-body rod protein FlgC